MLDLNMVGSDSEVDLLYASMASGIGVKDIV
jgi:hypothetical protein